MAIDRNRGALGGFQGMGPHRAGQGFSGGVSGNRLGSVEHHEGPGRFLAGGNDMGAGRPGSGTGFWLSNQQYDEYKKLLKERAQAQQIVSPPMTSANYPAMTLGVGGGTLSPYSITQPSYGYLAPPASGGKPSGYGGLPGAYPAGMPRRLP